MARRRLLLAAPVLFAAGAALAHPPRQPDAAESRSLVEEIKAFRARVARAVIERDRKALSAFYADAFSHTDETGKIEDRATRIAVATAGSPVIETAPARDLRYSVFAGPTVVVNGRSAAPHEVQWVAVYVTGRDGWQLASSQVTRVTA